jgi:hypothetical protein
MVGTYLYVLPVSIHRASNTRASLNIRVSVLEIIYRLHLHGILVVSLFSVLYVDRLPVLGTTIQSSTTSARKWR